MRRRTVPSQQSAPTPSLSSRHPSRKRISRVATRTSSVRTPTARTRTARAEDSFIVAVIDNPAREVGLCSYDVNGVVVQLRYFSDSNTYSTLIKVLCVIAPVEILLSVSNATGCLHDAIHSCPYLLNIKRTFIPRSYFDDTYGAIAVEKLSHQTCPHLARLGTVLYLSLACCGALIRYVEHVRDTVFAPSCLNIQYKPKDDTVFIDMSALEALELVTNARVANGLATMHSNACLLRVLDFTRTRAGKRFLRHAVLEPCAHFTTISMRQQMVEEISDSEEIYFSLSAALRKFPDLEKSMSALMTRESANLRAAGALNAAARNDHDSNAPTDSGEEEAPPALLARTRFSSASPASIGLLKNVLNIKAALQAGQEILQVIQDATSPLLHAIAESMRSPALSKLQEAISEVIDTDAIPSRGVERMRMNGALAVKFGRNGYLDVCRKMMSENIDDMKTLTEEMRNKYSLRELELSLHLKRGYHFSMRSKFLNTNDLPEEFIRVNEGKKVHRFSSPTLEQLNCRYQNCLQQIWKLSEIELGGLLAEIFHTDCLTAVYRLCDSVALLDCIVSFVTYSSLCQAPTTRPTLTEDGPICLEQAYHPTAASIQPHSTIPNDILLHKTSPLHIITGQNQSGKSFFMRMVGLVSIMAHTGCRVPAKSASVRVLHRIATRFNTADDISQCQSNFSKEMQDVAAMFDAVQCSARDVESSMEALRNGTGDQGSDDGKNCTFPSMLVLIDELGRSTSTLDGFSIAHAVIEELAARPNTLTLFTTHFLGLGALAHVNPLVKNFHFSTVSSSDGSQGNNENAEPWGKSLKYSHKITNGILAERDYGAETARDAGFPIEVLRRADELKAKVPRRRIDSAEILIESALSGGDAEKKAMRKGRYIIRIAERLEKIKKSSCEEGEKQDLMRQLQKELLQRRQEKKAGKERNQTKCGDGVLEGRE